MSNFNVPYTFVGGTKARAEEVNANFTAVSTVINTKADKNIDGTIDVGTATESTNAVNKGQVESILASGLSTKANCNLSNLNNEGLKKLQLEAFSISDGNINSNGEADLISVTDDESPTEIYFKIGEIYDEEYENLKGILGNGTTFERTSLPNLDCSNFADGTYNLFVGESGDCIPFANKIFRQKNMPLSTTETEWNMPTLSGYTTSTTDGDITVTESNRYSSEYSWYMFNNDSNQWYNYSGTYTGFVQIKFPYYLKITGLSFTATNLGGTVTFYTSSDKTTQIGDTLSYTANQANTNVQNINSSGVITDTLYADFTASNAVAGKFIGITATKIIEGCKTNDIWLDTSVKPYKSYKYNGSDWQEFNYVNLPQTITVTSGAITSINKFGNYNKNNYDEFINLPDINKVTALTNGTKYTATVNGWISNGSALVRPLLIGEFFVPNTANYKFYPMKGV